MGFWGFVAWAWIVLWSVGCESFRHFGTDGFPFVYRMYGEALRGIEYFLVYYCSYSL